MIISCPNCNKQFKINPSLIPDNGRDLKCGSCDHVWFYKIEDNIQSHYLYVMILQKKKLKMKLIIKLQKISMNLMMQQNKKILKIK
jgi:predicted Zn finger-like uncharacterized protein